MTFTRMLDWLGGTPAEANAAFDATLDAEPSRPSVPPAMMSKEEKRALLQRGIEARGEAPRMLA